MDALVVAVVGLIAVCAAAVLGPKLRVAGPLLLVAVGILAGFLPFVPELVIEPEWVLAGILPPLLYSASVAMPAMDFRREFSAISGLSVLLVVVTSLALGLLVWWLVPDIGLAWGIALGAVISPTDAVATSIVKGASVSPRIVSILEGEGLLNDATALVLLRTAVAASAASVSLWGALGDFAYAVVVAVAIGGAIGILNIVVRSKVADPTVTTALSFAVPFIASVPAEELGASGLVAAVVAGLITGQLAPRHLSPLQRLSDEQNWSTVELILEGLIFVAMGLQLHHLLGDLPGGGSAAWHAVAVALAALAVTVLVRAAYVAPLFIDLKRRYDRKETQRPRLQKIQAGLDDGQTRATISERVSTSKRVPTRLRSEEFVERRVERMKVFVRRKLADLDYLAAAPLNARDGTVVVWAGMRGAVTVAAAQTLPESTPHRTTIVLIAFLVAGLSLVVQGGTLKRVVTLVKPTGATSPADQAAQAEELRTMLREAAYAAPTDDRVEMIIAQRNALLDARDDGLYDTAALSAALDILDADQISIQLRKDVGLQPPTRAQRAARTTTSS